MITIATYFRAFSDIGQRCSNALAIILVSRIAMSRIVQEFSCSRCMLLRRLSSRFARSSRQIAFDICMSNHPITSEFLPESSRTTQDANARLIDAEQFGSLFGGQVRHREGSRRRAVDMMVCRPRAGVNRLRASLDSQEACGQFCCVVRANIVFNPRLGRSERDCVRGEDGFNCRVVRSVDNQERPRAGDAWLASVAELVFSCFNEWRFCGHRFSLCV